MRTFHAPRITLLACTTPLAPPPANTRPDLTEVMKFFCYSADAAIQLADPVLNPAGKLVFILDVCDFGFRNWDIAGAKMLFKMIHVSGGWRSAFDERMTADCMLCFATPHLLEPGRTMPSRHGSGGAGQMERGSRCETNGFQAHKWSSLHASLQYATAP